MRADDFVDESLLPHIDQARAFYATRPTMRGPQSFAELLEVRAQRATRIASHDPHAVTGMAEVDGHAVPIRILTPRANRPRGVYLDLHGGGFYVGAAADGDDGARALAEVHQLVVVGVDYRLAPEHPWPAATEDCATVARWLLGHAQARFGCSRIVVGGSSAGATLAMTTLLRLRARGLTAQIAGAALQFGTYDLSGTTPAGRLIADEYFLQAYLGDTEDRTVADISPVFAELSGLPPTLLSVGADDVLLQDNLAMAERLAEAGNDVTMRVYPASPHGFTGHPTAMAAAARQHIEAWIGARIGD
ncbi:alpha/beta hydrolase [Gordonia sp. ABSL1-1]|uniref:alpha/beta hydrolase n=1 Tax=Gordonia sp. ABSL1-1 TaxID=3053923 RepID=UPI0025736F38|nr:alpha/beta hydrolase [Gordonia sp. ABSL1-1]MDL9935203.1 alpha/beta hydrolase [Gordonia sp. ABSL1-1]